MARRMAVLFLALFPLAGVCAWESGFLISNDFNSENTTGGDKATTHEFGENLKASLFLSIKPGEKTSIYLKGSVNLLNETIINRPSAWEISGELDNAQINLAPISFFYAEVGRLPFRDVSGLIADGNYDGGFVRFIMNSHSLAAGAYYTGLLFRGTAKLALSEDDVNDYYGSKYFAPPHLFMTASYRYATDSGSVFFELAGLREIDMRERSQKSTNYILGKASFGFGQDARLNIASAVSWAMNGDAATPGFSVRADFGMRLPSWYPSRLAAEFNFFNGNSGDDEIPAAPMPVLTRQKVSFVYNPVAARLFSGKFLYLVRVSDTLNFESDFSIFFRTRAKQRPGHRLLSDYENTMSESMVLGEELAVYGIWTPTSDFSLSLGAGFFFPDSGPDGAYERGTPVEWDVKLSFLLSF